jgi:hypothetical protein
MDANQIALIVSVVQALQAQQKPAVEPPPPAPLPQPPRQQPAWLCGTPVVGIDVDIRRSFETVMRWRPNKFWDHPILAAALQEQWVEHPERFSFRGVHNSADGAQTYFSVYYNHPIHSMMNYVIHCYGLLRGSFFRIDSVDVFNYDRRYSNVIMNRSQGSDSETHSSADSE